mgnify:CR=1 FL=1
MRGFLLLIISILIAATAGSKDKIPVSYATATLSPGLKKDAFAICRDYRHEFELLGYGSAIEKVHLAITILEKNGDYFSRLIIPYDKNIKVKSLTGKSYNQLGLPDNKLKASAIQDVNYTSAGSLYDDLRLKVAEFTPVDYPYTIEYDYVIEHNGLISYPDWKPLRDYQLAVEKSSFKISWPESLKVRIKEFNIPEGCKTEEVNLGKYTVEWNIDSLPARKEEPMSPGLFFQTPRVICAPTTFIYNQSTGNMNSWKELGRWQATLNQGLDQLPEARKAEIRTMVGEIKDTLAAIQLLYQYMQKRTRYVGIQLGLGGYKPFPAETVDRLGYGDCKALSNYMKALLNCVGISSCFTLAGAGPNQGITMPDFPTINQNNHAILCVPMQQDTLWLECTSQTQPCGYLGNSLKGRTVLLITEEGGKLTRTPILKLEDNLQFRSVQVQLMPDGAMRASVKTRFTGYQYENVSDLFAESPEEQKKQLLRDFGIPGLVINTFAYEAQKLSRPEAVETVDMESPQYATKTGTRLFVPLNMLNQHKTIPAKVDVRLMPVIQSYSYHDKDSILFQLPAGYQIESIPKDKIVETEFGKYQSTLKVTDGVATYVREVKIPYGIWPKERYQELVDFYSGIVSSDKAKLVLKQEATN